VVGADRDPGPLPDIISSIRFHSSGEKTVRFLGTKTLFPTAPRATT